MTIVDPEIGNQVRNKAAEICTDHAAARAAWARVAADSRCHGKTSRAARFAMLQVIADGGSISDAEKAAWAVLE
jgi:hypothetical protein